MAYLSDVSLDGDRDNNSIFENSMYVLPTKTVLNSSLYLNPYEKTNYPNNYNNIQSVNSRKVGNNIEIPSYKGFSIAKEDYKSIHQMPLKPPKLIIDGVKMDDKNIKRKQNVIKSDKINQRSEEFLKRLRFEKMKSSMQEESFLNLKKDDKVKDQIKHTESFWADSGQRKPINNESSNRPKSDNVRDHNKHYDPAKIKNYIEKKQQEKTKSQNEKCQLQKEKEMRIKSNLRLLSQNQRKQQCIPSKVNVCNGDKKLQKFQPFDLNRPIAEDDQNMEDNQDPESSDGRYSTDTSGNSDVTLHSLKRQISNWQPLDTAVLENYANRDRQGIKQAIDNNRHVIKILDNISMMKDKIKSSTHEIMEFNKQNNFGEPARKRGLKHSSSDLSQSDMHSDDSSDYTDDTISEVMKRVNESLVSDIKPSILRKAAHRTSPDNYNQILIKPNEFEIDKDLYEDCVSRLLEENRKRYEQSLENQSSILTPLRNYTTKPIAPVSPYRVESQINIQSDSMKGDPLRFIKVYQKSSQQNKSSKHSIPKSSEQLSVKSTPDPSVVSKTVPLIMSDNHESSVISNTTSASVSLPTKHLVPKIVTDMEQSQNSDLSDSKDTTLEDRSSPRLNNQRMPSMTYNPRESSYTNEARLSPSSLERQFLAELDYFESVDVCMQQLLQTERLQGVSIAQQETVSLAQLLKARQWKEGREGENNEQIERFTNVLENITRNFSTRSRQKQISSSISNTVEKSSTFSSSKHSSVIKAKSSTETDASEIEEEIVDHVNSSIMTPKIVVKSKIQKPIVKSRDKTIGLKKDNVKSVSLEDSEIIENIDIVTGSSEYDMDKTDSEDKSIKEVSTLRSIESSSTITDNKNASPKEISTDKSVEMTPNSNRTNEDSTKASEKSIKELSTASSATSESKTKSSFSDINVVTESLSKTSGRNDRDRSDSLREISTARSETNGSKFSKAASIRSKNVESEHSEMDYSGNTFENSRTKSCKGDDSMDFENSDLEARINVLEFQKNKKKDLVIRLSKNMLRNKNIRKEKVLKDQIRYLNSQIEFLENEIKQSDGSLSSISSIPPPISKKTKKKEKKKENILPNYSSKSSSSSLSIPMVNKTSDKQLSPDISKGVDASNDLSSSSTLISDKDVVRSADDQKSKGKIDEIDTPRSVKQLQFGDINEEYSASDRDSSEIQIPSEKSRLSREVTDNGATKSKSERFHVLNLNDDDDNIIGNVPEDPKILQDDTGMMSARTIHSEMSDIIDECVDLSDREIEEIDNFNAEVGEKTDQVSEKDQESSYKDLYSDKFSESSSHKTTKTASKIVEDPNEVSISDKQLEYETSPDSSESHPPIIPPRRKEKQNVPVTDEPIPEHQNSNQNIDNQLKLVDSISEKMLTDFLKELVQYVDTNLKEAEKFGTSLEESLNAVSFELEEPLSPNAFCTLIPWIDEDILPLVDIAVEKLFLARMNRMGSTVSALDECANHLPEAFTSKNDEETIKNMIRIDRIIKTSDKKYYPSHLADLRHIDKMLIYEIVLEIVQKIYSLDDEPESSVWMRDVFNIRRNKMIRLWRGRSEPGSLDLVKTIVNDEMRISGVLGRQTRPVMKRSRLHDWFIGQHRDRVDQLLVDETIQDESAWNMYEKLEEDILFHWSDDILLQLVDEGVTSVLALAR